MEDNIFYNITIFVTPQTIVCTLLPVRSDLSCWVFFLFLFSDRMSKDLSRVILTMLTKLGRRHFHCNIDPQCKNPTFREITIF